MNYFTKHRAGFLKESKSLDPQKGGKIYEYKDFGFICMRSDDFCSR